MDEFYGNGVRRRTRRHFSIRENHSKYQETNYSSVLRLVLSVGQ